jgi:Flp pilus assembly pilin Flp
MLWKNFFTEEDGGAYATEMVVIIAAIGILLGVGVSVLFNAMSDYFGRWATFFSGS